MRFILPLFCIALCMATNTLCMEAYYAQAVASENGMPKERELRWDFAKTAGFMRTTPQDLQVKGVQEEANTVENRATLQQAFLSAFDALETDGITKSIDLRKLEALCAIVERMKQKPVQPKAPLTTDEKLAVLKATPAEKLFIRGLPYQKKEPQPDIAERLCTLPETITIGQNGVVTLEGPLINAFVYNTTEFIINKSCKTSEEHIITFGRLLQQSGRAAADEYCKQHSLDYEEMIQLLG